MALYSLLMGGAIFAMWAVFLAAGHVPELTAEPVRTAGHLAAEFLTGAILMSGGAGLLARRTWGRAVTLTGFGLLLYALAQAIAYWLLLDTFAFAILFAALLIPAPVLIWRSRPDRREWLLILLGGMLYAIVQTIGYFAQQREPVATVMFALLAAGTATALIAWGGGRERVVDGLHRADRPGHSARTPQV